MLDRRNFKIKRFTLSSPTDCLVCGESCNQAEVLTAPMLRAAYEAYFRSACPESAIPCDFILVSCVQCKLEFCLEPRVSKDFYPWVVELPCYYPEHRLEWNLVLEELATIGRKVAILEVGCGSGVFLNKIADLPNVTAAGIDLTESAIQQCKKQSLNAIVSDLRNYIESPPANLPKKFDFIVGSHVLEHVNNPVEMLRDCFNLLHPEGSVLMSLPLSPNDHESAMFDPILYPPHHLTRWHRATFLALGKTLSANVTVSSIKQRSAFRALSHTMFCALNYRNSKASIVGRFNLFLKKPFYWTSQFYWQVLRRSNDSLVSDHVLLKLTK